MIVQNGTINTTAQIVPGVTVQIVSPRVKNLNGIPTNVIGVVGTAAFGPVNQPIIIGDMAQYERVFGPIQARDFDMGTIVATAIQQGATAFVCVRVADSDAAATGTILTNCLTLTAKHTGSQGNKIKLTIGTGSKASTWRAVVSIPGLIDEVFDNISGSANAFWVNLAAALNSGNKSRGPSALVSASAGVGTTSASAATYSLTGGADGASGIDASDLVGVDGASRTGMYALRGTNASIGVLADATTGASWTAQAAFGLAEGIYFIASGEKGDTIAEAITAKNSAGLDTYAVKLMHGDFIHWNDPVNSVTRLVSPQGFAAGRLANLSPEQSSLNKPLFGVVGTQKSSTVSGSAVCYSQAELQDLMLAGIDVIANPAPGGAYWAVRGGINASSDDSFDGDNYTRLTNYLAVTLAKALGTFEGRLATRETCEDVTASVDSFLGGLLSQGMLSRDLNGNLPFSIVCNASNNPAERVALGYLQCDVQVRYAAVVRHLIVNLEGGQGVTVTVQN